MKNSIFFPGPKSHTQVGSLSAKNAGEKFSRLGTLNRTLESFDDFQISDLKIVFVNTVSRLPTRQEKQ
jgi:hypothetical protein